MKIIKNLFKINYCYFHIDEFTRDSVVASALKKKLKEKGLHLIYGNRRLIILLSKFPWLLNFCTSKIYPSIDIYKSYLNINSSDNDIFILPTESISGTEFTKERLLLHLLGSKFQYENNNLESNFKPIKKLFLWGKFHFEIILNNYPNLERKLLVVGHPRYDLDCLKKNINSSSTKKKVRLGFVSRFDLLNIYDSRTNIDLIFENRKIPGNEYLYFQNEERDQEDFYHNSVLDLRIFFLILDLLDLDKYEVYLRIHPREKRENWVNLVKTKNIRLKISEFGQPFSHWLNDIDLVLSPPSTSFYDYALLGKNAILIDSVIKTRRNHSSLLSDDFDPIFNYFKRPKSLNELMDILNRYSPDFNFLPKKNNDYLKILENEVNFPDHKNSLNKVADEVSSVIKKNNYLRHLRFFIFYLFIMIYTYLIIIMRLIRQKKEESASFLLTVKNIKKIDNLVNK